MFFAFHTVLAILGSQGWTADTTSVDYLVNELGYTLQKAQNLTPWTNTAGIFTLIWEYLAVL